MTLLVVNADDFGLTDGVSRAIVRAHIHGIVTSTSVLALGPAFARTAGMLVDHPGLGAGAHLAAVGEDPPLLSSREIPTLVDRRGRLRLSWRKFLPLAATGRIDPTDLRREFEAQLDRIEGAGIVVDHLDTHQNLHLWPVVRGVVLELGNDRGIRATRVTRSAAAGPVGVVVRRLADSLVEVCDRSGWTYPAASTGLDGAGHLDSSRMIGALQHLAGSGAPTAELATHPGEHDDADLARYRWGYLWGGECDALCSPSVRAAVDQLGFELSTFGELTRRANR
jgi:predicted glycoside hydrolase/deacetylase ChbG (UPF0249 family)